MKLIDFIKPLSEEDYRELQAFNYSILKLLADNGPKSLVEKEEISGTFLEFGTLVDILLTNPEARYNVFYTKPITKPTGNLLELTEALYIDHIMLDKTYEDLVTSEVILEKSKSLGLWSTFKDNTILDKVNVPIFYDYLKAKIESKGKIISSPELIEAAEHCANVLKTHNYTKDLFIESDDIEILTQSTLLYNFKGYLGKAKLDLIRIDHKNKIIYPYDIKTGSELPTNFENSFYHFKYYLQAVSYMYALAYLRDQNKELEEYKIDSFKFIYISKKLPDCPVIYNVDEKLLSVFFEGWTNSKGEYVKGFKDLVNEYIYYKSNEIYNAEKKVLENNGILNITLS